MTLPAKEMHSYIARLETFQQVHHLSKRRASSQSSRGKKGNTVTWPHETPDPAYLAKAGFFYRPASDSTDNVQCFLCTVKLDGWEPTDDPIKEHLAHSKGCAWATAWSVTRNESEEPEMRDPMADELLTARATTFSTGDGWTHEGKKGWKCKASKMVEAGWCWDPAAEGEDGDGVTCFYCNLSLDGWEPKDDPFQEHKRRAPDCRFFELLEYYHGVDAAAGKMKKTRTKGSARTSTASKTSRMSTQSAVSAISGVSDIPSMPGSFGTGPDGSLAGVDDSILTTATNASSATTADASKGKKKGGRTKAPAKGTKVKKKYQIQEEESATHYPDLNQAQQSHISDVLSSQALVSSEAPDVPAHTTKRDMRVSKQIDSSVLEISQMDTALSTKTTRTRRAKTQPEADPADAPYIEIPDVAAAPEQRLSEVSHQLQEELEHSVLDEPLDQSTPVVGPVKPKRGVKRSSDGSRKQTETESSVVEVEAPSISKAKPKLKGKRGRPKKVSGASEGEETEQPQPSDLTTVSNVLTEPNDPQPVEDEVEESKPASRKGRGRPNGKKSSAIRSSRSSKAAVSVSDVDQPTIAPDTLAKDELEIEQELERIAAEHAQHSATEVIATEHDQAEEFEPSPSSGRVSKDSLELQQLQDEVHAEDANIAERDFAAPLPRHSLRPNTPGHFPSPSGSDKENVPSSVAQPSANSQPQIILSPTKTTRIAVLASTPKRSPAKKLLSPSKQISHLSSKAPWYAVDLDAVLVASPQPTPGKLGAQLAEAAGGLTSFEQQMTVEQWIRHRAEKGEEELRRQCEHLLAAFEKEGMRAMESLNGIRATA